MGHGFGAGRFRACPLCVLPKISIVAGVSIAVLERGFGELRWALRSDRKRSAKIADGPRGSGHNAILEAASEPDTFAAKTATVKS
jgi:hypothetical protein